VVLVVPVEFDAPEESAIWIVRALVLRLEAVKEVVRVLLTYILYSKVVDHEGEHDRATFVLEKSSCSFAFVVAVIF